MLSEDFEEFLVNLKIQFNFTEDEYVYLKKNLEKIKLYPGEKLYEIDQIPSGIVFIKSGEMRLIGINDKKEIFTLEKFKPNQIAGAIPLIQGIKSFQLSASSEIIGLFLEAKKFMEITINLKFYRHFNFVTRAEYYSILTSHNSLSNLTSKETLTWIDVELKSKTKVLTLSPGKHKFKQIKNSWIISSNNFKNKNLGEEILQNEYIEIIGSFNGRLIPKPKGWLQRINKISIEDNNNYKKYILTKNKYENETIKSMEDFYGVKNKKIYYPEEKGLGGLEESLACFRMCCLFFEIPFKKELLKKIISEQFKNNSSSDLNIFQIASLLNLLGLQSSLKNIRNLDSFIRIPFPAIIIKDKKPIIIWEKKNDSFLISDPREGKSYSSINSLFITNNDGFIQVLKFEKTKNSPKDRFNFNWFYPYIKKYKSSLIQVVIASFFVQLLALFNPLLIQQIIDAVINQGSIRSLNILGTLLIAMAVFQATLGSLRTYLFSDTTNRIDMSLGKRIINHLFRLPLNYFSKKQVGEVSSRISELEKIRNFLTGTALTVILDSIFSIIYVAIMLTYSVKLTLWTLSVIPLFVLLTFFVSPILKRQLRQKAEANAKLNSHLVETISGIETIKGQGVEMQSEWRWEKLYGKQIDAGFRNTITTTAAGSLSNFLQQISGLIVIWVGASLVLNGQLSLGQLIAFRILSSYVTNPLLRISSIWQDFQEISISLSRLSDIVDYPEELEITGENLPPLPPIKGDLSFDRVDFSFENSNNLLIKNINLMIDSGDFVGVVGSSGSGKSTLLKLILRFYEIQEGKITVDGFDISKVDLYSLRSQIGIVQQESLLFEGTIQTNLSIGKPFASFEEIVSAAKLACAHEFIEKMHNGYSSPVTEKGSELSGGQRQRLAIARMIINKPNLIILDEATSALDIDTEKRVLINLKKFFSKKTIIFISHRINSLIGAKKILVIHDGKLVEKGNHNSLMKLNGRYANLYNQQDREI